jgi:hypothetical protein
MIGNFTAIGSTSNTQPIANKNEKFLFKMKTGFASMLKGSIPCIAKPVSVKKFLAVARV